MFSTVSSFELVHACQVLFSSDEKCSVEFVQKLDSSTLKVAYRKKALETHPDRQKALGKKTSELDRRFREVQNAYDVLKPVAAGDQQVTITRPAMTEQMKTPRSSEKMNRFSSYYQGAVPQQKLLFGQFLYYSGIITWKTLVDAISWQRRMKPLYGQIAINWNMLALKDVETILRNKNHMEKFGQYAKRKGYLSGFQHLAIMGKQRQYHQLFGMYFVDKGIFSQRHIDLLVKKGLYHNLRVVE